MNDEFFIKVLNQTKDNVFRYGISITRNYHDAEDIVQESYIKLYNSNIDDESYAKNWLFKAVHNAGINLVKSRWKSVVFDPNIIDLITDNQKQEEVSVLFQCPFEYRTILYLYYYEGYSQVEIAEISNLSVDAVKKRMQRGREYLKKHLKGETFDE